MDRDYYFNHWSTNVYDNQQHDPTSAHGQMDDVRYILSTMGNAPKRVLEVACGGGRILESIARAGHHVTGFEMDDDILEKCTVRIKDLKDAACYKANAVTENWGTYYEVVVMGGNLLVNIEGFSDMDYEQAQRLFINKAASSLVPHGRLFLECVCEAVFPTFFDPQEYTIPKGKMI